MLPRYRCERRQLRFRRVEHLGNLRELGADTIGDLLAVRVHRFLAGLGEHDRNQRIDRSGIHRADRLGHIAGEAHPAPLPPSSGQDGIHRGFQP